MDIIYSRKLIRINKKRKIVILILLLVLLFCILVKEIIYPIFITNCEYKAKTLAIEITNDETKKVMDKYSYEDLINIQTDNNGNISFLESNIVVMNKIISEITANVQKAFQEEENNHISINLGVFTGTKILSSIGPKLDINIVSAGNIETNVRSEFFSVGVNQSIHRIYLDIVCGVNITTPISSVKKEIKNQVLLGETVIVGNTPETNYTIESIDANNALDVIN